MEPKVNPSARHELTDLSPRAIALFAAGILVAMAVAVVITTWFIHFKQSRYAEIPLPRLAGEREQNPQPRLEVDAARELRELRAGENTTLSSYGWVDRDAGVVRIPLDRAMDLLANRGLPARPEGHAQQAKGENGRSDGAAQ